MAEDLATVRARIRGVGQLDAVIGAMRGIAAAHAQQSRTLLPAVRAYAAVVARAIAQALRLLDGDVHRRQAAPRVARVVFCPEQGFVGAFAEHVLAVAAARGPADVFLLGSRGLLLAAGAGIRPLWNAPMATQVAGIPGLCIRVADALYEQIASRQSDAIEVVFPIWSGSGSADITCHSLLPLDAARFPAAAGAMPPVTTLPPDALLAGLAEEYVFASLCEAAFHAFAAENEARAAAMVRARGKVQDMLGSLALTEHRVRQEAITGELIELSAGVG